MGRLNTLFGLGLLAITSLVVGACAAEALDEDGQGVLLLESADGWFVVPRNVWAGAPAGCEGRLDATETFARAEGTAGLIVAVRGNRIVCVDTPESIDAELSDYVHVAAAGPSRGQATTNRGGANGPHVIDPVPQPSQPRPAAGEPSPQPSEPSPQPSEPSPQPSDPGTNDE